MYKFKNQTQKMVLTAVFAAIIILMANVPFLGYLNIGLVAATTVHIPVIIGAVLLGPGSGAFLGFIFGLTSFIKATFQPTLTSFCFTPFYSLGTYHGNIFSLVIAFIPRILIGVGAYYVFAGLMKVLKGNRTVKEVVALPVAGVIGSMINTILVMGGIYVFFGSQYAAACAENVSKAGGTLIAFIMTIVIGNGIPEAIVSGILTAVIGKALLHVVNR